MIFRRVQDLCFFFDVYTFTTFRFFIQRNSNVIFELLNLLLICSSSVKKFTGSEGKLKYLLVFLSDIPLTELECFISAVSFIFNLYFFYLGQNQSTRKRKEKRRSKKPAPRRRKRKNGKRSLSKF